MTPDHVEVEIFEVLEQMEMTSAFTDVLHVANLTTGSHLMSILTQSDAFSKVGGAQIQKSENIFSSFQSCPIFCFTVTTCATLRRILPNWRSNCKVEKRRSEWKSFLDWSTWWVQLMWKNCCHQNKQQNMDFWKSQHKTIVPRWNRWSRALAWTSWCANWRTSSS